MTALIGRNVGVIRDADDPDQDVVNVNRVDDSVPAPAGGGR
jgi:hypothetical protein